MNALSFANKVKTIEVGLKEQIADTRGELLRKKILEDLHIPVDKVTTQDLYLIQVDLPKEELEKIRTELLTDPILQDSIFDGFLKDEDSDFHIVVHPKPGVTDNLGKTAQSAIEDLLGRSLPLNDAVVAAQKYLLKGVNKEQAEKIAQKLLVNDLIQNAYVRASKEVEPLEYHLKHPVEQSIYVETISLELTNEALIQLSHDRLLALNLKEMQAIRDYFSRPEVILERKFVGLGPNPTDVELESIAQTWSEHCHHKVFNALIHYTGPDGQTNKVDSLFKTYIKGLTEELNNPFLISVFHDNAGVVRFHSEYDIVYKIETHNSPSALDPYGGAMTGIVGVDRDPMGTGKGAELLAHIKGYCLGNPFFKGEMPGGLLHPKRIRDGVHAGVIDGGNQSGIPLMRGFEIFDDSFSGKPLVFCGTLGRIPHTIQGQPSHIKEVLPGDLVLMVGGRVGKDGIHGATFSSIALSDDIPAAVVQIGDPITQKKMADLLREARDKCLYRGLTDNGAGGLSSSAGEMAQLCGGLKIDLAKVPLKYPGLQPWEIFLSESQERMTLAVPAESLQPYMELSEKRKVESTVLGKFTKTGKLHLTYGAETVAYLDMEFLHKGDPRYELTARWESKTYEEPLIKERDHREVLLAMMARLNLCSREDKLRQYDHEVKGLSVIKPLIGVYEDFPPDATVMMVDHSSLEGIILAEGINPYYSQIDTYHMATSVVDEAVRRIIATGGQLGNIAGLDNFCWPNTVDDCFPERSYKLAQLVRANQGLYDACKAYNIPLISGKDSMANDCTKVNPPISILPTLLFSAVGRIPDISLSMTMDVKKVGDLVYVIGETNKELGGSEYFRYLGELERGKAYVGNAVPCVDFQKTSAIYQSTASAVHQNLVTSCHTPTKGGLLVALAQMSCAGNMGVTIDLHKIPRTTSDIDALLYSESNGRFIVTVSPEKEKVFIDIVHGISCVCVGKVRESDCFIVSYYEKTIVSTSISQLTSSYKSTFGV